ncbi:MAG: succinate dehydrogenase / fumarate reductase cytochrome b subunit [Planctomycetota bacterium]|jgi:succinate dehydrogenase / fumarate reductase cytochrome b subunit
MLEIICSSLWRKRVMALTGGWLCVFLAVHLAGNLALFLPAERAGPIYNAYTAFMTGSPVIKLLSLVNYLAFAVHSAVALLLVLQNRRASGARYACARPELTSPWHTRNMGFLGSLVLAFLVIHLKTFWFRYHYGAVGVDADGLRDLYGVVCVAFREGWYVALYAAAMLALGLHLLHGVSSAFRTLGLHHRRYWRLARVFGIGFAAAVSALFGAMPLFIYFFR